MGRDGVERRGKAGDFSPDGPCPSPSFPHRPRPCGRSIDYFPLQRFVSTTGVISPTFGNSSYPPCPHQMQHCLKNTSEECPEKNNYLLGRCSMVCFSS